MNGPNKCMVMKNLVSRLCLSFLRLLAKFVSEAPIPIWARIQKSDCWANKLLQTLAIQQTSFKPWRDLVQNPSADASASSSKALKLTIFNQQPSPSKALASGPSAVDLLQRKHMGQGTSPAKPALALTNGTEAVSPKSSPKTTMKDGGDGGKKNSDVPAKEEKSLEDYENEAMEMLMKRPAIALFDTVLKKPAAKNSSPSSSSKVPKLERTIFGCLRCRGNPLGCETCRSETFGGKRFEGRSAYNAFVKAQAAKGKVYK